MDWKRYIKDRLEYVSGLEKNKLRRINISLESWENVCESIESIIHDGQVSCKKRRFASENLLSFMDLPLMDPIEVAMPSNLKLE